MAQIPTVRVVHDDGFVVINQCDFDSDEHVLWCDPLEDVESEYPVLEDGDEVSPPFAPVAIEIESASTLAALKDLAQIHGLTLDRRIKRIDTAKRHLLEQVEERET